jgi:hypothetical protein
VDRDDVALERGECEAPARRRDMDGYWPRVDWSCSLQLLSFGHFCLASGLGFICGLIMNRRWTVFLYIIVTVHFSNPHLHYRINYTKDGFYA